MGKQRKTRKFSVMKKTVDHKKALKEQELKKKNPNDKSNDPELTKNIPQVSSALFFQYNSAIKPPYQVLVDTNFFNFSIQKKIDIVTDCVLAELEKLGSKYRIALKLAKDPRLKKLKCTHKGTYADDCLVNRVLQHKCFIVATNDAALKVRIRKIPGVPLMSVGGKKYVIEKLPDVF